MSTNNREFPVFAAVQELTPLNNDCNIIRINSRPVEPCAVEPRRPEDRAKGSKRAENQQVSGKKVNGKQQVKAIIASLLDAIICKCEHEELTGSMPTSDVNRATNLNPANEPETLPNLAAIPAPSSLEEHTELLARLEYIADHYDRRNINRDAVRQIRELLANSSLPDSKSAEGFYRRCHMLLDEHELAIQDAANLREDELQTVFHAAFEMIRARAGAAKLSTLKPDANLIKQYIEGNCEPWQNRLVNMMIIVSLPWESAVEAGWANAKRQTRS